MNRVPYEGLQELFKKEVKSKYRYNEDFALAELNDYIDKTYDQHYSQSKFQAAEFIIDAGHGVGFCVGNIMKYAQRYGKKGGYNRKDIFKIIHYAIMLLFVHDTTIEESVT
jgi:hypothetical protein